MNCELDRDKFDCNIVAFGEFRASDIMQHAVCQDDFTNVEPGLSACKSAAHDREELKLPIFDRKK